MEQEWLIMPLTTELMIRVGFMLLRTEAQIKLVEITQQPKGVKRLIKNLQKRLRKKRDGNLSQLLLVKMVRNINPTL